MSRGLSHLQRAILEVLPDREHDVLSTSSAHVWWRGGRTVGQLSYVLGRPEWFCVVDYPEQGFFIGRRDDFGVYRALRSLEQRGLVYRVAGSSRRWLRTSPVALLSG